MSATLVPVVFFGRDPTGSTSSCCDVADCHCGPQADKGSGFKDGSAKKPTDKSDGQRRASASETPSKSSNASEAHAKGGISRAKMEAQREEAERRAAEKPVPIKTEPVERDALESVIVTPSYSSVHPAYFFSIPTATSRNEHDSDDEPPKVGKFSLTQCFLQSQLKTSMQQVVLAPIYGIREKRTQSAGDKRN